MNVPAIRKALDEAGYNRAEDILAAVVRVGLRACDEYRVPSCDDCGSYREIGYRCPGCRITEARLEVIADILREAGVEVEK